MKKLIALLGVCIFLNGCATMAVNSLVGTRVGWMDSNYYHPAYQLLYVLSVPFDIATSPIQMLWLGAQL